MFSKLRENKFDISKQIVIDSINFTYKIMTCMLQVKCKGVFLKPLVIAGSEFICTFQEVMANHLSKLNVDYDVKAILNIFLINLKQERDIDWIYFEILANIFDVDLNEDDINSINKAKERLDI
jgi:hypothetical protein